MDKIDPIFMVKREGDGACNKTHKTFDEAREEADRLSQRNPGVKFYVLAPISYSICEIRPPECFMIPESLIDKPSYFKPVTETKNTDSCSIKELNGNVIQEVSRYSISSGSMNIKDVPEELLENPRTDCIFYVVGKHQCAAFCNIRKSCFSRNISGTLSPRCDSCNYYLSKDQKEPEEIMKYILNILEVSDV